MINEFENCPDLAKWMERLANSNIPSWSMSDWGEFCSALNNALVKADATAPRALLAMALDFIVGDSNPREHDDERELVINQLRIVLNK